MNTKMLRQSNNYFPKNPMRQQDTATLGGKSHITDPTRIRWNSYCNELGCCSV